MVFIHKCHYIDISSLTHSYWGGGNINSYLQHIVQKYLQFINVSATIRAPFEQALTGSHLVSVKFLLRGFTLSWRWPLTPPPHHHHHHPTEPKFSKARKHFTHWVWQTRGLIATYSTAARVLLVLFEEAGPSGALKSRRTPGTLSPREGCGGCGGEEKQAGGVSSGVACVRKTRRVPAFFFFLFGVRAQLTCTHK